MAFDNRELLARIIQCEAGGEGDDGMRAVASVIMNRVHTPYGEYRRVGQGDVKKVIYQDYQFDCTRETLGGQYNPQNIYNMRPEAIHYEIADWALSGGRLGAVSDSLWYYNPDGDCRGMFPGDSGRYHTSVRQHCFYRPTEAYKST